MNLDWLMPFKVFCVYWTPCREKADKKPTKRGPFFLSGSSYDRDKQNEREYFVQKEEPADADH